MVNRPQTLGEFLYNRMGGVVNDTSAAEMLRINIVDWFALKNGQKMLNDVELSDLQAMTGVSAKELDRIQCNYLNWKQEFDAYRAELERRYGDNRDNRTVTHPETKDSTEECRQPMTLGTLRKKIMSSVKEYLSSNI